MTQHAARLRRAADRLRSCPFLALRSQTQAFLSELRRSGEVWERIGALGARERPSIKGYPSTLIDLQPMAFTLYFANSYEEQAATGVNVLEAMLQTVDLHDANQFADRLCSIGAMFREGRRPHMQPPERPIHIQTFVQVLVDPIVDYVELSADREELIATLMARYKRRCEWFRRELLQSLAAGDKSRAKEPLKYDIAEGRLKRDFYEYLFDNDVEFSVDPQGPGDQSRADVLSYRFPDGARLVCEAKVFDGAGRGVDKVKKGIGQAAYYANQWGEPVGYLLVYNVKPNARLTFTGARQIGEVWSTDRQGKTIRIVSLDLGVDVPATQSAKIQEIPVPCQPDEPR